MVIILTVVSQNNIISPMLEKTAIQLTDDFLYLATLPGGSQIENDDPVKLAHALFKAGIKAAQLAFLGVEKIPPHQVLMPKERHRIELELSSLVLQGRLSR